MNGEADPCVRPEEARAIHTALRGPKTLEFFAGVGHESCLRRRPDAWQSVVSGFLDRLLEPSPPVTPRGPGLTLSNDVTTR
jgi:hypothetical protein